jgi:hypothetical protein
MVASASRGESFSWISTISPIRASYRLEVIGILMQTIFKPPRKILPETLRAIIMFTADGYLLE